MMTQIRLAARVLEAEHRLYPECLRLVLAGDAVLEGDRVRLKTPEPGGPGTLLSLGLKG